MNEASLIFKKLLIEAELSPYVFDSIAKNAVRNIDRQGAWLEIADLLIAPPNESCPNAAKLFSDLPLKIVAYCGHAEFAGKNSCQELTLTRGKDELIASVFLRVESESYLNGIATALRGHRELSLWMRLDCKDDALRNIEDLTRIPLQHLSLSFS